MKLIVIIPAYNEELTIGSVIKGLKKKGYNDIIVVDDGSSDKTFEIASKEGVNVYKHMINRGLGGALNTGITGALREEADLLVTFDADGQHDVNDIPNLVKAIEEGYDVAIGNRINKDMPFLRRIGNVGLDFITYLLFGIYVHDSQSGLRMFTREAAAKIEIKTNRMEVSSEIITEIGRKNLKLKEVSIKTIYTEYSMSKGNSVWNGFKIALKLFLRRIM